MLVHSPKVRSTLVLLLIIGCIALPFHVFSQSAKSSASTQTDQAVEELNQKIAEKRDKIKQLEESIERVRKDIDKKRLEAVSLKNQMSILDNRLTQVQLDITLTEEKLATLRLEIEALSLSIEEKEAIIVRQKTIIAELIRALHYQDGKNVVEVLAAYDTFSDFYNKLQYLETIERELAASARTVKENKLVLEERRKQTENRKISYEELREKLDERRVDYDEQLGNKQVLLAQTQSSELTYKTLLANLRKQSQDIENEISSIEQEVRRKLEEQKKLEVLDDDSSGGSYMWPVQSKYITAYFHDPDYPYRNVFQHSGIDIRAGQGTSVKAASSGYIARAKRCSTASCYSYIMIIHSGGLSTVYGHLSGILVAEDQFVNKGDVIGYSGGARGSIGAGPFVTGPHLHFEVRRNGIPINPVPFLK